MRLILIISATIISNDGYLVPMSCDKVFSLTGSQNKTLQQHPDCEAYFSGQNPNKAVLVSATMDGNGSNVTAVLSLGFGAAFWLAFTLHAVGVEIYVSDQGQKIKGMDADTEVEATPYAGRSKPFAEHIIPATARGWYEEPWPRRSYGRQDRRFGTVGT